MKDIPLNFITENDELLFPSSFLINELNANLSLKKLGLFFFKF